MGENIEKASFTPEDIAEFQKRLKTETKVLMNWMKDSTLHCETQYAGFELEAWLTDENFLPKPCNEEFLKLTNHEYIVPEISKYNFELNSTPQALGGKFLSNFLEEMQDLWTKCIDSAAKLNANVLAIGSLPTLRDEMLTPEFLSSHHRYEALNNRVFELRNEKPIKINIEGKDQLKVTHEHDVMVEAGATSLQIHIQPPFEKSVEFYNASQIASALIVAACANSPYFYGKELWDETRIPVFEQAVFIPTMRDKHGETLGRVTFGTGYARESLMEVFLENLEAYPVLLPMVSPDDPAWLYHLRLHNGTIWRWTRPIIGVNKSGQPHLRIEHRTPSSGPSLGDVVANIAFATGLINYLADKNIVNELPFDTAKENFYNAAKNGLNADFKWTNGTSMKIQEFIDHHAIEWAKEGLRMVGTNNDDIKTFMDDIIKPRILSGRNGAFWQKSYIETHGHNTQEMTEAYHRLQNSGLPVHEWNV